GGLGGEDGGVGTGRILRRDRRRPALFADAKGGASRNFFDAPAETAARVDAQVGFIWSQACTGKFVWPIPDKGLKKHIHLISTPTLIIWGAADGVIAPAYAEEFARRIPNSRVELIEAAGHLPHLEQADRVARLVRDFLRACKSRI